jgi:hypothetical protein
MDNNHRSPWDVFERSDQVTTERASNVLFFGGLKTSPLTRSGKKKSKLAYMSEKLVLSAGYQNWTCMVHAYIYIFIRELPRLQAFVVLFL